MEKITTSYWAKPVPERSHDWCAYRDPEGKCGYGSTQQEAINDLLEQEGVASEIIPLLEKWMPNSYAQQDILKAYQIGKGEVDSVFNKVPDHKPAKASTESSRQRISRKVSLNLRREREIKNKNRGAA